MNTLKNIASMLISRSAQAIGNIVKLFVGMLISRSAQATGNIVKLFVGFVITVAIVVGMYPTLNTSIMSLNTTFNNSFTNAIAGGSGLIALVISIGIGYMVLMGLWKAFMGSAGK